MGDSGWFLTLEGSRVTGEELTREIVDRIHADRTHVIIDACHASMLALPRGPGGERRTYRGFVELGRRVVRRALGICCRARGRAKATNGRLWKPGCSATRCAPGFTARPTQTGRAGQLFGDRGVRRARQRGDHERSVPAARGRPAAFGRRAHGGLAASDLRPADARRLSGTRWSPRLLLVGARARRRRITERKPQGARGTQRRDRCARDSGADSGRRRGHHGGERRVAAALAQSPADRA